MLTGRASESPARLQLIFQVKGNEHAAELRIGHWSWEIGYRYLSGDIRTTVRTTFPEILPAWPSL
jgi:hypothetical protein